MLSYPSNDIWKRDQQCFYASREECIGENGLRFHFSLPGKDRRLGFFRNISYSTCWGYPFFEVQSPLDIQPLNKDPLDIQSKDDTDPLDVQVHIRVEDVRPNRQIVSDPLDIHVFCAGPPGYPKNIEPPGCPISSTGGARTMYFWKNPIYRTLKKYLKTCLICRTQKHL